MGLPTAVALLHSWAILASVLLQPRHVPCWWAGARGQKECSIGSKGNKGCQLLLGAQALVMVTVVAVCSFSRSVNQL